MRSYSRGELHQNDEDLDVYEEDGEGEEAEAWEEDYYREEDEEEEEKEKEDRKPTKEELDYLQLRQRIKESVRKKMKKEYATVSKGSLENKKRLPYDNYGSFFGPSQPVIAQRVIQESKSLIETQHLASRITNPLGNKKAPASITEGKKPALHTQAHRVVNELKVKAQKLKDARDYSFLLSDDAELPAPPKEPAPRNVSVPSSDARSAHVSLKSNKQSMDKHGSRPVSNGHEERKPISINRQIQSQAGPYKAAPCRPNLTSADPRKQLGSNAGNGPGRPVGPKGFPSKMSAPTMEKKAPTVGAKNNVAAVKKPALSKVNPVAQKKHLEQKREIREPHKARVMAKQAVPSKPQVKDPKQGPMRVAKQEHQSRKQPARRPFDEDEDELDYTSIIRGMFRYNPDKFAGRDDEDSDMEANFEDILAEERKSARIAREEDERELRLIEEEERRERMKKKMQQRKQQLSRQ
ncbi:nucleolar and coiled-body phosphoprotein 1-like [Macadamia integrifolia]|uniref:nucleolar and coiled-body phosphoprotein 1-like n=1 Tax=Macadamia integrifolia TaxID=60698 RepID=UPI001C5025E9|nr:nucleolar and coiled-body phosphoprotein 1-like [Macadamia integrifolia]